MSKKYLSLEEAAAVLRMGTDELIRLREKGGIRGFADRGTWKFREDDVQQVQRSRQPDSDPDVPILVEPSKTPKPMSKAIPDVLKASDSEVKLVGSVAGLASESDVLALSGHSDSDVKLVGDVIKEADSDSDVKLVDPQAGKGSISDVQPVSLGKFDSDSDVALVGDRTSDSDSDVALVTSKTDQINIGPLDDALGSDSDVRLVADAPKKTGSDSDVKLVEPKLAKGTDSDVALLSDDDQPIPLLSSDSGIALNSDSSGTILKSESGIKLDSDEGITLDIGHDSGISLEAAADSGISLESVADSGISLEDGDFSGTMPMMNALKEKKKDETVYEIPSLKDDSAFELATGGSDETAVFDLEEVEAKTGLDDAVFDLDEAEPAASDAEVEQMDEDLDMAEDVLGEDDEIEDLDVFDADEEVFEEGASPAGQRYASPVGVAVEHEWGTGTFVGLLLSTATLVVAGMVMFDLVHNIWAWNNPTPVSSTLLDSIGGLYK